MPERKRDPDRSSRLEERSAASDARRLDPTPAEAELERILCELAGGALRGEYRRESPVGDWTLDFYFPAIGLAIEVDGGYHRAQHRWRLDLARTRDLEARGITVLRLANPEVFGDREHLLRRLRAAWRAALAKTRRGPATLREPCRAVYRVTRSSASIFSTRQASPRELGEPLAVSYGPA